MENKVKPIYFELQGYLSQAPEREEGFMFEEQTWIQLNHAIDELEKVTSKKYERYKINPKTVSYNGVPTQRITTQEYRTILGGLIFRLHGEYFPDEAPPISK